MGTTYWRAQRRRSEPSLLTRVVRFLSKCEIGFIGLIGLTARIAFIDLPRLIEKVTLLLLFQDREIGGLKRFGNNSSQDKSRAVKRASVPRAFALSMPELSTTLWHGNDRPPVFTQEMAFICQELMPDPYFSTRDKSRASLSISGTRVLCFVVLIDSLYPQYSRNSRFD